MTMIDGPGWGWMAMVALGVFVPAGRCVRLGVGVRVGMKIRVRVGVRVDVAVFV